MGDDLDVEQLVKTMETYRQEFKSLSESLEKETSDCVSDLNSIADDVDKFHRGATIANVTGSAFGIAGGITTIVGLALIPVTLGASLIVSGVGIAVATAGGITGASASIADIANTKSKCNIVTEKVEKINGMMNDLVKKASNISELASHIKDTVEKSLQDQAPDLARIGGKGVFVAVEIGRLVQLGKISTAAARGVELASQGARAIRAVSAALSVLFLVVDTAFLVRGAIELHRGARTETAAEIRNKAFELLEKWHEVRENNSKLISYISNFISELREIENTQQGSAIFSA